MVNYTEVLETPSKTFQLKQKPNCTNCGIYAATCTICSKQYVGQTMNKFSIRWNAHRSIWNSFVATAYYDKAALLKHFYKYHDLTQKPPISQCFKVTFVEQSKASYCISRNVKINSVTGKFACNNLLLNRKQTCWNILKPETVRTNQKKITTNQNWSLSQLIWLKTAILGHWPQVAPVTTSLKRQRKSQDK